MWLLCVGSSKIESGSITYYNTDICVSRLDGTGFAQLTYLRDHQEVYANIAEKAKWLAGEMRRSAEKFRRNIERECAGQVSQDLIDKLVKERLGEELKSGVQTIQYQINTLMTTNGQSPFVTLFLYLRDDDPFIEENALIIEEILRQRLEGIKNAQGVYITPAFPKLVYVLDENNCLKGGKYDYITDLAVRCSAKRMEIH